MKGKISEIFESIQGEGIYFGERQVFVRLYGCNLSCQFCDTKLDEFFERTPEEVISEIEKFKKNDRTVVFTGGEPLVQKDFLVDMMRLTRERGYKNYLETNGTLVEELKSVIDLIDVVAMDLKFPSSCGEAPVWDLHRKFLDIADDKDIFLKAVICATTKEEDLLEAINIIRESGKALLLVLQPNSFDDYSQLTVKLEAFKAVCAKNHVTVCVIPQIHRIVGAK